MSVHPNVILMAVLTPDDLSRKTMREIIQMEYEPDGLNFKIGDYDYHPLIMEGGYDDGWQIASKDGDLIFLRLTTYNYGEFIEWDDLQEQKEQLEKWAKETSKKHNCTYSIRVSANYW